MRPTLRLTVLAGCLAFAWAAALSAPVLRGAGEIFEAFEHTLFDLRVLSWGERHPPDEILIVALDDATLASSTVGSERQQLTALVERLTTSGARVLAVDILLADAGPDALDAKLTVALGRMPTIVAGAAGVLAAGDGMAIPHSSQELWPRDRFLDAADVGLVNIITGASGFPRYSPSVFATSRGIMPSFPLLAASEFAGDTPELEVGALSMGPRTLRLDQGFLLPLRPYGPAGTIPTVSAVEFLMNGAVPEMDGKLIVLGNTATGMGDRFPSPFGGDLTGAEVIATAIGHFLEPAQVLTRSITTRRIDAALACILAVTCTVSIVMLPLAQGGTIALVLLTLATGAIWVAFAQGFWLAAALPLASAGVPAGLAALWRYACERRAAVATDRAMTELKKFQSPQLARLVEANPTFLSSPQTVQASILFVDLAGFTALSQALGPEETEHLLKRFHRCVTGIVHDHGGVVVNYMGDGALAVFGLPEGVDRAEPAALDAAFDLVDGTRVLDAELGHGGRVTCRVGLHFGTVILSRLGDDRQQQFSVSGDSVNLSSRLLEAAKTEGVTIAASALAVAPDDLSKNRRPDLRKSIILRGREGEVDTLFWRS